MYYRICVQRPEATCLACNASLLTEDDAVVLSNKKHHGGERTTQRN